MRECRRAAAEYRPIFFQSRQCCFILCNSHVVRTITIYRRIPTSHEHHQEPPKRETTSPLPSTKTEQTPTPAFGRSTIFSSSGRFTAGRSTSSSSRKRCYRQRPDCHQLRACYGMRVETEINEEKNLETRFFSCSSCKLPSSWCPRAIRPYTRSLAAIACLRLSPSAIPLTSSTNLILI